MSKPLVLMASAALIAVMFGLSGCIKAQPFDYDYENNPKGPGLISGKSGEIVIYRSRSRRR